MSNDKQQEQLYTAETAIDRLFELGRYGRDTVSPIHPVTLRVMANKHNIGRFMGGMWIFTEADLQRVLDLPHPGRPFGSTSATGAPEPSSQEGTIDPAS